MKIIILRMRLCFSVTLLFFLLFTCNDVLAQEFPEYKLSIHPYVKYRQEDLRWSIAGDVNGQNPNILSELIWKRLQGPQVGLMIQKNISRRFSVQADMSYMGVTTGRVTDTDYRRDDRQDISFDENLRSDRGYSLSFDARLQYLVYIHPKVSILPFLGFTNKYQHVFMLDNEIPLIKGSVLKSTYTPHWYGGTAGGVFVFNAGKARISLEVSGDLVKYSAKANWNLRSELAHPVSFKHSATGKGVNAQLFVAYPLCENIYITLNADISHAETGNGTDKTFYESGKKVYTRLNSVVNKSYGLGFGLKFKLL
ncbi:hypothetical protein [Sinomicrobium sp. M5D2P17]